jgi:alkanesulfonate monooxygenase SsuD/methylene tetrahydromethanopterin reductase-like flavin-dependent oxidoreductase (luciferase family)
VLYEVVDSVRDLLAGKNVSMTGEFVSLRDVVLDHPPPQPPRILVGTTGRRGLEIAGRFADGALLPQGATPAAVRWARSLTATHDPASQTVVYAWLSMDDDITNARAALIPEVERWRDIERYPELARRLPHAIAGPLSPEQSTLGQTLDEMAIVGDPPSCASAVRRFAQAGADSVVLRPPVVGAWAQIERFAAQVFQRLGSVGA